MKDKSQKDKSQKNNAGKNKSSNFDQLLDELNTLQKSFDDEDEVPDEEIENPEDDAAIAQAAGEGGTPNSDDPKADDPADVQGDGNSDDGDEEDELMGKSFTVKLEDGTELEAMEGTDLIKSLKSEISDSKSSMVKALGLAVTNMKSLSDKITKQFTTLKSQGALIKSLQENIERIGDKGKGRKTVISVHEKRSPEELRKSDEVPEGLGRQEFMAKALSAQREGKVTGLELSQAESYLNRGLEIPVSIVNKVLS